VLILPRTVHIPVPEHWQSIWRDPGLHRGFSSGIGTLRTGRSGSPRFTWRFLLLPSGNTCRPFIGVRACRTLGGRFTPVRSGVRFSSHRVILKRRAIRKGPTGFSPMPLHRGCRSGRSSSQARTRVRDGPERAGFFRGTDGERGSSFIGPAGHINSASRLSRWPGWFCTAPGAIAVGRTKPSRPGNGA